MANIAVPPADVCFRGRSDRNTGYLSDIEGDNVTNRQPGNIARAWELWKARVREK